MPSFTNERPYLQIEASQFPQQTLLRCVGEIDLTSAECLLQALTAAITAGSPEVVVDLREVQFLDSAAIRVLVRTHAILRDRGRSLEALVTPGMAKLFHLLQLDDLFPTRLDSLLTLKTVQ
jgi:anti-sigma B factor antagonist